MPGETSLQTLLRHLRPRLNEGAYVFCALPAVHAVPVSDCLMLFREAEAVTAVLTTTHAQAYGLSAEPEYAWITLDVHSSLEAVGLTAVFSQALAAAHISCNVVAGFYHDHIFVNIHHTQKAMQVLNSLQQEAQEK